MCRSRNGDVVVFTAPPLSGGATNFSYFAISGWLETGNNHAAITESRHIGSSYLI